MIGISRTTASFSLIFLLAALFAAVGGCTTQVEANCTADLDGKTVAEAKTQLEPKWTYTNSAISKRALRAASDRSVPDTVTGSS